MASADQNADESGAEVEGAPKSLLAHIREYWQILALIGGASVLFLALVLWQGPLNFVHRDAALRQLAEARELWEQGKLLQASQVLAALEPNLWRIENRAGDAYFLMGVVSNGLAEAARGGDGDAYRAMALPYLREAVRLGVSPRWQLPLYGETGKGLFNAGNYAEAVPALVEAVAIRRNLERVIDHRLVQGVLMQRGAAGLDQVRPLLQAWSAVPGLSAGERDFLRSLKGGLESGEWERVLDAVAAYEGNASGETVNAYVYEVDQRAAIAFELGHVDEAVENLEAELRSNSEALSALLSRLVTARVRLSPPDYAGALADGKERMGLFGLPVAEVDAARLRQAEILLDMSKPRDARAYLEQIVSQDFSPGVVNYLLGRSFFDEGRRWEFMSVQEWEEENPAVEQYGIVIGRLLERGSGSAAADRLPWWMRALREMRPIALKEWLARANYAAAVSYLERVLKDLELRDQKYFGLALLELGLAEASLGNYVAADDAYERAINAFPGSDFERAALFFRADAYRRSGRKETLDAFQDAVEANEGRWARGLRNPHLPPDRLREIFAGSWRAYQTDQKYQQAMKIAELYLPFAEGGVAYQMRADSAKEYADELLRRAAGELYADAQATRAEARTFYGQAGADYLNAAKAELASEQYPELLWLSAVNSYEGHAYAESKVVLEELLESYGGGQRDSAVNLLMARCEMSQGEFATARATLETFLERLPRSPNRFEARIDLAECYLELGESLGPVAAESDEGKLRASYFQRARELLAENIDGLDFDLEPTALAWQRSLFVLGRLYHEEGRYDEAIRRLREAIQRYPDAPQVYDAMYRIADSYRQWARAPEEQLRTEETPRGRMLLEQDRNRRLQAALVEYETLATRLAQVQESRPLSPDEQALMRSSFFTIGDVYASLQDWPAAIEAFTTAANRFQDRPDCLAAYVQIANAYLRQGRISEAGSTLRQARWVLNQIDESLFVDSALSKEQWKNRLDSLVGDL